jgi:mono/diheme cytochrome c family protein
MRVAVLFVAISAAVLGIGVATGTFLQPSGSATSGDSGRVSEGKVVYERHCASCHGAKLEGQPNWQVRKPDGRLPAPPHDASGHTWHHPDKVLVGLIEHGPAPYAPAGYLSDMPGFRGVLSEEQIGDVLAYIKSTWPPEVQRRHRLISERAGQ